MFENIDLSRPFEDPLVVALQLLQNPAVVSGLLQVWKGDAGSEVDFITQRLGGLAQHYRGGRRLKVLRYVTSVISGHGQGGSVRAVPCLCNSC